MGEKAIKQNLTKASKLNQPFAEQSKYEPPKKSYDLKICNKLSLKMNKPNTPSPKPKTNIFFHSVLFRTFAAIYYFPASFFVITKLWFIFFCFVPIPVIKFSPTFLLI